MRATSPVALVHDYLLVRRGAERTFEAIAECWPEAPIYTLLYDREGSQERFAGRDVRTSFLQRLRVRQSGFRRLLPAFPRAVRSLPLDRYELVVSSSSAFAHGIRTGAGGQHVCYCHSPFRYAWFETERALAEVPRPLRPFLKRALSGMRARDRAAAQRVDRYLANSELTRERIATHWSRDSEVLYPPVEVDRFSPSGRPRPGGGPRRHLLVVSELVPHKRVDLALEAARIAGAPIRVVGEGPERSGLEARFGRNDGVEFLGRVDDDELSGLYASARALVLPNVEEFGIAAVEAQAAGRPVVAAAAGGALETVVDGETGVHVPSGDERALARALAETDFDRFDSGRIADHARRFSREAFQRRIVERVEALRDEGRRRSYRTATAPALGGAPLSTAR